VDVVLHVQVHTWDINHKRDPVWPSNPDPSGQCGSLPYLLIRENKLSLPRKILTVSVNDFKPTSAAPVEQGKDVKILQMRRSLGNGQPAQTPDLSTEERLD